MKPVQNVNFFMSCQLWGKAQRMTTAKMCFLNFNISFSTEYLREM